MSRIVSDYSALDAELLRVSRMPGPKMKAELKAVLDIGFKEAKASTHVITGSLKGSGKKKIEVIDGVWIGEIGFGGLSLGVNNPVNYAIYEKARGADHNNLETLPDSLHFLFVAAILNGLSK